MPKNKLARVFYDLMLTMGFSQCASSTVAANQLFEAARKQLGGIVADDGLNDLADADAVDFFNNKLIQIVFFSESKDYGLLFSEKSEPICQIIKELKS